MLNSAASADPSTSVNRDSVGGHRRRGKRQEGKNEVNE